MSEVSPSTASPIHKAATLLAASKVAAPRALALLFPLMLLACEPGTTSDCPVRAEFAGGASGDPAYREAAEAAGCITPVGEGEPGCPGQDRGITDGALNQTQAEWIELASGLGCFDPNADSSVECPGQYSYETPAEWQARACQLRCWPAGEPGCSTFCPGQQEGESVSAWQERAASSHCFESDAYEGGYCPGQFGNESLLEWQARASDAGCAP